MENLERILAAVPDAMIAVEGDQIVASNEAAAVLFDYDTVVGFDLEELVPRRYRALHHGQHRDFLARGRRRQMGSGVDIYGMRRDGSEFRADISLAPYRSQDGRTIALAAIRNLDEIARRRRTPTAKMLRMLNTRSAGSPILFVICMVTIIALSIRSDYNSCLRSQRTREGDRIALKSQAVEAMKRYRYDRWADGATARVAVAHHDLVGYRLAFVPERQDVQSYRAAVMALKHVQRLDCNIPFPSTR